jgi:hypothetical protein
MLFNWLILMPIKGGTSGSRSMQRSMPTFEQMTKITRLGVLGKITTIYAPVGA